MAKKDKKDKLPSQVGPYKVLRLLGSGSMASVLLAEQEGRAGFRKKLALKVVKGEFAGDPTFIKLLMREAAIGGLLRHPNIIQTLSFEQYESQYVLVLEYVAGQTLRDILKKSKQSPGGVDPSLTIDICSQICRALDYAHALEDDNGKPLQIIHRDLKPANLMLSEHGVIKIMDFGIARAAASWASMTAQGIVRGTPAYMSPEQVLGKPLDGRSDLFSLGVILCELLTGKPIFRGGQMIDVMERVARLDIGNVITEANNFLPGVDAILHRLLTIEAGDRFTRGAEVRSQLKKLLLGRDEKSQRTATALTAIEDLSSVTAIAALRPKRSRRKKAKSGAQKSSTDELAESTAVTPGTERRGQADQLGRQAASDVHFDPSQSVESFIYQDEPDEDDLLIFDDSEDEADSGEERPPVPDPVPEHAASGKTSDDSNPWDGELADAFFGDKGGPTSRSDMGPADPSDNTVLGLSSDSGETNRPSARISASVRTDDLERDILDGDNPGSRPSSNEESEADDDELWSDAPAEGSALLAEAMTAMESAGELDPELPEEDDELWAGLDDLAAPLPEAPIETHDPIEISEAVTPPDLAPRDLEVTAEQLVAAVRSAVEITDDVVSRTLVEFPAATNRKAEKRKERMTEKVADARGGLAEVERAVAAAVEADTETEAEIHLAEARAASKSVETTLNKAVSDGQEAMRLARSAISKALAESSALKAAVAHAESAFSELQQLEKSVLETIDSLSGAGTDDLAEVPPKILDNLDAQRLALRNYVRNSLRCMKRVRAAAKSSTAQRHGTVVIDLVTKQRPGIQADLEAGVLALEEMKKQAEARQKIEEERARVAKQLERAQARAEGFAEEAATAAEEATSSKTDLEESIQSFQATERGSLGELTLCLKAEAAARGASEDASVHAELAASSEDVQGARNAGDAAKMARNEAMGHAEEARLSALRGRRAAAAEASNRAAKAQALAQKEAEEEAERARIIRVAKQEEEARATAEREAVERSKSLAAEAAAAAEAAEAAAAAAAATEAAEVEARMRAEEAEEAEAKRRAEEAELAEEKRRAEEAELAEEKRRAEEAELAEEKRRAEEAELAAKDLRVEQEEQAAQQEEQAAQQQEQAAQQEEQKEQAEQDPELAAAAARAHEAQRFASHLVRRLEASGAIPTGSDLERLLTDAQNRGEEVAFAAEELEQLLSSPARRASLSAEELLQKCTTLAEQAEAAARETETSVSFAAQLGGLELPSLSDLPGAIEIETQDVQPSADTGPEAPDLPEEVAKSEGGGDEPEPAGQDAAPEKDNSPDEPPGWLEKLLKEAKETGTETSAAPAPATRNPTQRSESPKPTPSVPSHESEASSEPTPDWKDDWGF